MSIPVTQTPDLESGLQPHQRQDTNALVNDDSTTTQRGPTPQEEEISRIPTASSQHTTSPPRSKLATLAKTITARSNASVVNPGPPPDGGIKAWTQACMGHLVILNTWGMIATFGVFQTYYTNDLGMEPSAVSWIGSMQMLGHFGLGTYQRW